MVFLFGMRWILLCRDRGFVCKFDAMTLCDAVDTSNSYCSHGFYVLDHLAADGAGLAGGEVAVVALLQVDANLGSGLLLEQLHRLTRFGDIVLLLRFFISVQLLQI